MTSTDLDPRFDPRYQRGYDAEQHVSVPAAARAVPVGPSPAVIAGPELDQERTDDGLESDNLIELTSRRRNPFLITLFVLPVGLIGAAVSLLVWYAEQLSRAFRTSSWGFEATVVVPILAPALIVTGFVSLITAVTIFALGGRPRG